MTTRRTMLKGALMGGAAAMTNGFSVSQAPSTTVPIRLGLASYTLRNFDRATVIRSMSTLQLTALNAKDVKDHLPSTSVAEEDAAIRDYKAAGITLTAAGTIGFPKDDDADIRAKFEYVKRAGIPVIVADPEVTVLPRLERFVKEYDIRLAIHNHGPEHKVFHSPLDVLHAIHGMDPRIGCCVDVGHTMRAGVHPVDALKAVGARLYDVHMKDLAQEHVRDSQVAAGRGLMPVKAIFETLIAMQYPGHVDLEYEIHPDDPMPGVIESFAYMRGILGGMGYKA